MTRRLQWTACIAAAAAAVLVAALWWWRLGPAEAGLRLVGTVTEIGLRRPPDPGRRFNWVVTTRVDAVLVGGYDRETFSFVVHSPHQEGLREGGRYVIDANRESGREFEFVAARAVE